MCGRVVAELSGIGVFEASPVAHECHPAGLCLIQTCSKMVRGADINVFIIFRSSRERHKFGDGICRVGRDLIDTLTRWMAVDLSIVNSEPPVMCEN